MAPNHRLKRARELRGWSQAGVAQQLDTDATTVSRWERGLFVPTPSFREKLCALFASNAEELGLMEPAQMCMCGQSSSSFQSPTSSFFSLTEERLQEDLSTGKLTFLPPPSWEDRTDTYTYILQSAAYDQQAYELWKEAYVQVLRGQRAKARFLGEASLQAFERIGHPSANVLRDWLMQEALISSPELIENVSPENVPSLSLP